MQKDVYAQKKCINENKALPKEKSQIFVNKMFSMRREKANVVFKLNILRENPFKSWHTTYI